MNPEKNKLSIEESFREFYKEQGISVEYESLKNGFGRVRLKLNEQINSPLENTPILLIPGIANPKVNGGEFGGQIIDLLSAGADYIDYIHFPYDRVLDVNEALEVISKSITVPTKLSGVSIGADIILEFLSRGEFDPKLIDDVLLISPYLAAEGDSYGSKMKKLGFNVARYFPKLVEFLWPVISDVNTSDTTVSNFSNAHIFRDQLTIRKKDKVNTDNKIKKLLIYWTTAKGELGEFADKEMRTSIHLMGFNLAESFGVEFPFKNEHGTQNQLPNHYIVGTKMVQWYLRNKLKY
jgi:hypothetical protein